MDGVPGERGIYFPKRTYADGPLPVFAAVRPQLPQPLYEAQPGYVQCYWAAWEAAFRHMHAPEARSGLVSNFVDAAFNENIFLWDTAFITMYCNLAHPWVPGIRSLDNFYCTQFPDGEICREIVRATGQSYPPWVNVERQPLFSRAGGYRVDLGRDPGEVPQLTLDALNHPIAAWAELECYAHTGELERLAQVYPPLWHHYQALRRHLRNDLGLYVTDWASMDNSPRNAYLAPEEGTCAPGSGLDISCEMVLLARQLAEMADILAAGQLPPPPWADGGWARLAHQLRAEAMAGAAAINAHMWDPATGFYYDLAPDGRRAPVRTVAAFWALLAGVARPEQAAALVQALEDPRAFARPHPVPSVAADEPQYDRSGGYWRGAVWPPTNTMIIRGLQAYGYEAVARRIALRHMEHLWRVWQQSGTFWENYAPEASLPGTPSRGDFVGWSGLGPILLFMEFAVGLKGDARRQQLRWEVCVPGESGCQGYWFAGRRLHLRARLNGRSAEVEAELQSGPPLTLCIRVRGQQKRMLLADRLRVRL